LQKFTIELLQNNDTPFAFAKFGHDKYAQKAILKEKSALQNLSKLTLSKIKVPELIEFKLPTLFSDQCTEGCLQSGE